MKKVPGIQTLSLLVVIAVSLCMAACGTPDVDEPGNRLAVTILPQRQMLQRLAGDRFDVDVLIPPGFNPATYSPAPDQIRRLSRTRIWFRIGRLPFELNWTSRIASAHPALTIVDTSAGTDWIVPERKGAGGGAGVDPHIWLSPRLAKIQARHMTEALIRLDPENRETYQSRCKSLEEDIADLDANIRSILRDPASRRFLVFHPSWGYFARDYGLFQVAIEKEGKGPAPASLAGTVALARREGLRVVFVQHQFDTTAAEVVAREIGGRVEKLDPLAEDWFTNLEETAKIIGNALREQSP